MIINTVDGVENTIEPPNLIVRMVSVVLSVSRHIIEPIKSTLHQKARAAHDPLPGPGLSSNVDFAMNPKSVPRDTLNIVHPNPKPLSYALKFNAFNESMIYVYNITHVRVACGPYRTYSHYNYTQS